MKGEKELETARDRVVESIAKNMSLYGVAPSIGMIYGTLYLSDQPMTLDHLKDELQMSKTSMSTGVRTLMDLTFIEKVWKKGERKDLFQFKDDWYQNFLDFFAGQLRKGSQLNLEAMAKSKEDLEAVLKEDLTIAEKERAEFYLERINYAMEYYEWLEKVVDLFESKEIFDVIAEREKTKI
jgi:DNA-binding transcriptional regulator GbsR (MarR family)